MALPLPRLVALTAVTALALPGLASRAEAHPHVFVVAKETVMFGADGQVAAIRADWTFDDMYSTFLVQGLGEPGKPLTSADLAPLAKTNVESLAEFGYFTVAKAAGKKLAVDVPIDYSLTQNPDKSVTLHFTLPLTSPAPANRAFTLQVYDPTYFVSFELAKDDPVGLAGAPAGCSANVVRPQPLDNTDNQKLSEAFFSNMSPGLDFGIKLASRVVVACP